MAIGVQVERCLEAKGWTQSRLARITGLPQSTVNSIVRNDPRSTPHLQTLADGLSVSPSVLMSNAPIPVLDAPESTILTAGESAWVEIYRALDERSRAALMHIAQTMVTGVIPSTVNAPKLAFRGEKE